MSGKISDNEAASFLLGMLALAVIVFLAWGLFTAVDRSVAISQAKRMGLVREISNGATGELEWQYHRCSCSNEATWVTGRE